MSGVGHSFVPTSRCLHHLTRELWKNPITFGRDFFEQRHRPRVFIEALSSKPLSQMVVETLAQELIQFFAVVQPRMSVVHTGAAKISSDANHRQPG